MLRKSFYSRLNSFTRSSITHSWKAAAAQVCHVVVLREFFKLFSFTAHICVIKSSTSKQNQYQNSLLRVSLQLKHQKGLKSI